MLAQLQREEGTILFIDEIHTIIGAGAASGGVMDASNLIKPMLASGELKCIGSTTYQEYRGIFEKDRALARRFQKIDVGEPSEDESVKILQGLKSRFEEHHKVRYTNQALRSAVELTNRYINDRHLPDKAIDIIDEAGARQRLLPPSKRRKTIGVNVVVNEDDGAGREGWLEWTPGVGLSKDPSLFAAVSLIGGTEEEEPDAGSLPPAEEDASGGEIPADGQATPDSASDVTELDEGGSVPELRVRNLSGASVLLLDGEELMGAKQNRVLNTSVMVS